METQAHRQPSTTLTASSHSGHGGDIVARSVLVLLLIMSLASWYVMLTKLWDQRKLKKSARVVEKQFWTAPSVKDGVERLKKGDDFRGIAEDGLRAASHHDGRLTDRIDLQRVDHHVAAALGRPGEQQAATAASGCSPPSARWRRSSACSARCGAS